MAPKKRNTTSDKPGAGKVKRLKLKKETVRDLSVEESGKVKGGRQWSLVDNCSVGPVCNTMA